ncbi:transporter substrate-binding domain-containing protein [Pseudoduganella eburnea]|uniref:Transporter substrate-binding domain-containing protein n=1 Tax=Massilia eburnea TaxID=1776165 RepID=A0A6L6QHV7_9BURK|nr:transporter substrate-binding domain-containing protein [Massilia eburnea]MTW12068.1 transporter substrate-binding domain-containing protein [Massilia eburnea]
MTGLRRRLVAGLAGALALAALPLRASRQRPLRAVALAIAPYAMVDANGRKNGMFVDAFELIERVSGRHIDVTVAPYARAIAMLRSGEADLMIATSNSVIAEAAEPMGMLWTADVIAIGRAGLVLEGQEDLRGRTVGVLRGSDYGAAFLDDSEYRRHEITDQLQAVRMLQEGRLDATLGTRLAVFYAMRLLGVQRARLGPSIVVQSREIHLHLGRRSADDALETELRHAVQELRSSGKADRLQARYLAGLPSR